MLLRATRAIRAQNSYGQSVGRLRAGLDANLYQANPCQLRSFLRLGRLGRPSNLTLGIIA
jgi:hypothetical protein